MQDFSLAHVLLATDDFTTAYKGLYYRAQKATFDEQREALMFSGVVDFATYFNALPWVKWRRYANVGVVKLHIDVAGDACEVYFSELFENSSATKVSACPLLTMDAQDEFSSFEITLPSSDAPLVSFELHTSGSSWVRNVYFSTVVDESSIRDVRLALCTTTFKKEEYIIPNIEAIKREVVHGGDPIAGGFHLYVVDNGSTLDAEELSGEGVTVIPNANVGGAGGFARGMLAGIDNNATHVLLMDDDVRVSPESFKRTFNLLSLVKDQYLDAFLNGAMLSLEQPNLQYEDVAFVRKDGVYDKVKPDLLVDEISAIVANETMDTEVDNAYGAWWYCCIPIKAIHRYGLPLPVFVRCDDVEYGLRCNPVMMSMSGICVWHSSFEGRFRASVDCYQFVRNFLIMIAVNGKSSETAFMARLHRTLGVYLRSMNYESAELLLDGLEDYLKGPEFIQQANGEEIMKRNGAKNERLVPVSEISSEILRKLNMEKVQLGGEDTRGLLMKALELFPHDRHILPDFLLSDTPAPVYYSRGAYPGWRTMRRKTLVAFDAEGEHAHIRTLDRDRYRVIKKRYRRLKRDHSSRRGELRDAYKTAAPYLTSQDFWREYLSMEELEHVECSD